MSPHMMFMAAYQTSGLRPTHRCECSALEKALWYAGTGTPVRALLTTGSRRFPTAPEGALLIARRERPGHTDRWGAVNEMSPEHFFYRWSLLHHNICNRKPVYDIVWTTTTAAPVMVAFTIFLFATIKFIGLRRTGPYIVQRLYSQSCTAYWQSFVHAGASGLKIGRWIQKKYIDI